MTPEFHEVGCRNCGEGGNWRIFTDGKGKLQCHALLRAHVKLQGRHQAGPRNHRHEDVHLTVEWLCPNCGQWHPANVIQCGLVSWTPQRQTRSVP